jgi:hypothetical protein
MISRKRKVSQIPEIGSLSQTSKLLIIDNGYTSIISAGNIVSSISAISIDHINSTDNPHNVTKSQLGLGNVDNTSDINKPLSNAVQLALNGKQDALQSGLNIKTINGQSLLGVGNISILSPVVSVNNKIGAVSLTTQDIVEEGNLYYTSDRVQSVGDARYVLLSGSYSNPAWLFNIDWNKITNKPTTLFGFGISDPVLLSTGSYNNPSWINTLSFTKLTDLPDFVDNLNDLLDVQITSPQNKQVLMYDGVKWKNAENLAETKLTSLTDVQLTSPINSDVLQYDGTTWINVPASSVGATTLSGLSDVDVTGLTSGSLLSYTGTTWGILSSFNTANNLVKLDATGKLPAIDGSQLTGLVSAISSLSDVTISSLVTNQYLRYNGTSWVNVTPDFVSTSGSYANPSWITSLAWSKITTTPTTLAGYGITDPVVLTTGSYSNPAWITALAYSKITGVPSFELSTNKSTDVTLGGVSPSATLYTTQSAVKTYVDNQIAAAQAGIPTFEIDMFANYKVYQTDEAGLTIYVGKIKSTNGAWLIERFVDDGSGDLTVTYANVSNNSGSTTPTTAWNNRTTLNYAAINTLTGI